MEVTSASQAYPPVTAVIANPVAAPVQSIIGMPNSAL